MADNIDRARARARSPRKNRARRRAVQPPLPLDHLPATLLAGPAGDPVTIDWLARLAVPHFGDWCALHSVDEAGAVMLEAVVHIEPDKGELVRDLQKRYPPHIEAARGIGKVIRTGEAEVYPDISPDLLAKNATDADHADLLRRLAPASGMVVPLVARGRTLGALSLFSSSSGRRYSHDDLATVEVLAREGAVALDNARLFRQAQEAERQLRELVEGLDAILWEADADTLAFSFVSRPAERILGYRLSEWTSDPFFCARLVHPEDRDRVLERCRAAIGLRQDHELQFRAVAADGGERWIRNLVRVVVDQENNPIRVRGIMIDITERRAAAIRLTESEERFRKVFEEGPVGMALVGAENRLVKVNAALCAMLGYRRDEMQGTSFVDFVHPADVGVHLFQTQRLLGGETRDYRAETRFVAKGGDVVWADLSASIVFGQDGTPLYGLAIVQNVSEQKRAMEALREAQERLELVITNSPVILFSVDAGGVFTFAQGRGLEALGSSPEIVLGKSIDRFEEFAPEAVAAIRRALKGEEMRNVVEIGDVMFDIWYSPVRDRADRVTGVVGVATDVTARVHAERALRASEERYRELFENANDIVYTHDLAGNFTSVNRVVEQLTGYGREETLRMNIAQILCPEYLETARKAIATKVAGGGRTTYEVEILAKDGRRIPLEVSTRLIYADGKAVGIQGIARDITERKAQTEALQYQALHDSLTDLPNRLLVTDRLRQAILAGRRANEPVALLLMDLDHFKEINDTLGHHKGDLVLQQIGPRIAAVLRESDTVARLGGDEFAVLLPCTDAPGAAMAAARMLQALEPSFLVEDLALDVRASIGIAIFPEDGDDENLLIQRADVAMYVAKQSRAGYAHYRAEHDRHSPRRLALAGALRRAIESDELILYFQPTIDLRTGELTGVEALVRWPHPDYGLLVPDEFIPLAEHTGLIRPLTLRVLHAALRQCREWRAGGIVRNVAVNLSARSLHDPRLPDTIASVLATYQLDPDALTIEITESAIMEDPAGAMALLGRISAMGTRLTIDDFGTGYSSLMHLKRLPVDEIKIDKSFVINIARDESDAVISRSTIDLGHNLGLKVVAEGVETREALGVLVALGCDIAQGHYVAPPMPAADVPRWLRETRWGTGGVIDLDETTPKMPAQRRKQPR